jgi:ABC-type branched-subunit amino acid transport system substrate-binding protein
MLVLAMPLSFAAVPGGKVLSAEAIAPTDVDMHPVLTKIAAERPDVIYMPIFVAAAAQMLRQCKEVTGLEHVTMVGGGSLVLAEKFDGLNGPIACDAFGQCAKFKPAVYEFVSDDPRTSSMGKSPRKVWL